MKKYLIIFIICNILFIQNIFSQNYHIDYAFTVFYDDFTGNLNRDAWDVVKGKLGRKTPQYNDPFYMWVDNDTTVNQNSGNLQLKAIYSPNYSQPHEYNGTTLTKDYISGEVWTKKDFTYGVFECGAIFEYKKGAFPAFWLYNDDACAETSDRPEIDIVEMKYYQSSPTLDYNIFCYDGCPSATVSISPDPFKDQEFTWSNQISHTFKCVYLPSKVEFSVDNGSKLITYVNQEQRGFPDKPMHIGLSQQLHEYNGQISNMELPSKSTFHWVKAKEFFEVPTINCPFNICSTGGSTYLNVDTRADTIEWSLTPSSLFSGTTSGLGKTASITAATGASGQAKITYTFKMPSVISGEIFTVEKTFWVGKPGTPLTTPSGYPTLELGLGAYQPISLFKTPGFTGGNINWWSTGSISPSGSTTGTTCTFEAVSLGTGNFYVTVQNTCGTSPIGGGTVNVVLGGGGQMMLVLSPNPTTGETILSIEPTTEKTTFDETTEWDLEIYDQTQSLKEKKTKLKGKSTKIQTSDWKEGVYAVRVKYKDEILLGKLVVKK